MTTTFRVHGEPRPQGSKTMMRHKQTGRTIMLEGGDAAARKRNRSWRSEVVDAARAAHGENAPLDGPLKVEMRFVFPRPKSARKAEHWKATSPDVDKLVRAVLDALTISRVIADDARVAMLVTSKELADAAGVQPIGCAVRVTPLPHDDRRFPE